MAALACVCLAAACDDPGVAAAEGQLTLTIAPQVGLAEIDRAEYSVEIITFRPDGTQVRHNLFEDLPSDGPGGALTLVASCNAGASGTVPQMGLVNITLHAVYGPDGVALEANVPQSRLVPFNCLRHQDTFLNLTFNVVLPAPFGSVDIVVDIDDVHCSAKIDCVSDLLSGDDETRGDSLVIATTCTGDLAEEQDDLLSVSHRLVCEGADGARVDVTDDFVQRTYTGALDAPGGGRSAFWNMAMRVDDAEIGGFERCDYDAVATVRSQPRGAPREPRITPDAAVLRWEAELDWIAGLHCRGDVTVRAAPVAVEQRPSPADSTVPAEDAPVTWSTMTVFAEELPAGCAHEATAESTARRAVTRAEAALADHDARAPHLAALGSIIIYVGARRPGESVPTDSVLANLDVARSVHAAPGFSSAVVAAHLAAASVRVEAALAALDGLAPAERVVTESLLRLDDAIVAILGDAEDEVYAEATYLQAEAVAQDVIALVTARMTTLEAESTVERPALVAAVAGADAALASAKDALTACLVLPPEATAGLYLWNVVDNQFPVAREGRTPRPDQSQPLIVSRDSGQRVDVTPVTACAHDALADPNDLWLIISIRDRPDAPRLSALRLRMGADGLWSCDEAPRGGCQTFDDEATRCAAAPHTP